MLTAATPNQILFVLNITPYNHLPSQLDGWGRYGADQGGVGFGSAAQ